MTGFKAVFVIRLLREVTQDFRHHERVYWVCTSHTFVHHSTQILKV